MSSKDTIFEGIKESRNGIMTMIIKERWSAPSIPVGDHTEAIKLGRASLQTSERGDGRVAGHNLQDLHRHEVVGGAPCP